MLIKVLFFIPCSTLTVSAYHLPNDWHHSATIQLAPYTLRRHSGSITNKKYRQYGVGATLCIDGIDSMFSYTLWSECGKCR